MYEYCAKVVNVVDGDTVDLKIDLGFHISVTERFRLYGINTPEKIGVSSEEKARAVAAQLYLMELVDGRDLIACTYKDKKDKYGRYLVILKYPCVDEKNNLPLPIELSVNQKMVLSGHAVAYME